MTKMIRRGQYTRNVSEEIAPPIKENTRGKKFISQDYSTTYILRKKTLTTTFCKIHWHIPSLPKFYLLQALAYLNSFLFPISYINFLCTNFQICSVV